MDSRPSNDVRGPQIYVHVEFGVSWTKKPPKNHELTYRSRNLQERTPHFPRQVPAPNTNYLAAIHSFERRQTQIRQGHRVRTNPEGHHVRRDDDPRTHHQLQEYYQAPPPPYGRQDRSTGQQSRPTRGESRASHERGHSAPPPIGENPWDVNVRDGSDSPRTRQQQVDHWKALPANPSQFRLGEGGLPWSTWSWPFEYQPETPDHDDDEESLSVKSGPALGGYHDISAFATSPTMVSTFSPGPKPSQLRDRETGRTRDLGALSAAMMTVDNGFENQWWNQGEREVVTVTEGGAPQLARALSSASAAGWSAVAVSSDRPSSAMDSIISPISASDEMEMSPRPAFQSLQRTLSTRSEELFFTDGRR